MAGLNASGSGIGGASSGYGFGGGAAPPNSVTNVGNAGEGLDKNSLSPEKLAEHLTKLSLYSLFTNPPSATGSTQAAEEWFEDADPAREDTDTLPWRTIFFLLDSNEFHLKDSYPMDHSLDVEEFLAFIEKVAAQRKAKAGTVG